MYRQPVDYIAITQDFHDGKSLDYGYYNHPNQPIYSIGEGKVYKIEYQKTGGNVIFIKHKNGDISCYGHLDKIFVKVNQKVKIAQQIATMGDTGYVYIPKTKKWEQVPMHLHLGIYSKGKNIYGKSDINPFEVCLVYPTQKVCQSGNTKKHLKDFRYYDDKAIWEKGTYKLLYDKAIRKDHSLGNNIVKVKECDKGTKEYLTSKKPNDDAYFKKGTEVKISDIFTQGKRVWGQYGNCWIVLCNIDGTKQAQKLK